MSAPSSARTRALRQLRRAKHAGHLARPGAYEVLSVNDDFTDHVTDIPALCRDRRPLAVGGQETKDMRLAGRLWDLGYGVQQRMDSDATAGVMVAWEHDQAFAIGDHKDVATRLGNGWLPLVHPRENDDMLTRGVVWQDIEIRGTGIRLRIASTHRPPARHRHLWRNYDLALEAFLDACPIPVILLADANELGGPDVDDDQWRWRGIGIDGAVTNMKVPSVYELAVLRSDHRAVSLSIRPGARGVAA